MERQRVGQKLTKVGGHVNYASSVIERSCDLKKTEEVHSKARGRHQITAAALITEESDQEEPEEDPEVEELEVVGEEAEEDEEIVEEEEAEFEEIVIEEEEVAEDEGEGEEEIEIIEETVVVEEEEEEEEVEIEEIIEEEEFEEEEVPDEEEFEEEEVPDEEEEPEEDVGDIKDIPKELHGSQLGKEPEKISNEGCRKEEPREESCERAGVSTEEEEEPEEEEEEEQEEVEAPSEEGTKGQLYDEEQNEEAPADISMQQPAFCIDPDANKVKSTNYFSSSRQLADAAWRHSQRQENLELWMGKKSSSGTVLSDVEKKLAGNSEGHQNISWEEQSVADGSADHGGEADGKKRETAWSNVEPHLSMQGCVTDNGADAVINLVFDKINKNMAENKSCQQQEVETREIKEEDNEMEEEEDEGEEEGDEDEEDPYEVEESFQELPKEQLYEEPNKESVADFPISTMFDDTGLSVPTKVEGDEEIEVEEEEEEGEDEDEEEPDEVEEYSQELAKTQLYEEKPSKESVVEFAISTELADAGLVLAQRKQNLGKKLEVKSSCGTVLFDVEKDHAGISGKRRKSRWGERPEASGSAVDDGEAAGKKRKTRWSNDEPQVQIQGFSTGDYVSPDIQALDLELFEINKKLEALSEMKTELFHKRTLKNAKFPFQVKPSEFQKKLYIPLKEYPNYNFIGLILGPNGQTHKEMEKKTGARIYLRGKGSRNKVDDPSDKDDLHVLVSADDQSSLDEAVGMVENILVPVDDNINSLKKQQLRELEKIKSQLMLNDLKRKKSIRDNTCELCGTFGHFSFSCPLTAPNAEDTVGPQQARFLSELGGGGALSFSDANSMREPPLPSKTFSDASSMKERSLPSKTADTSNLYVGCLPVSMDHTKLKGLFSAYGKIDSVYVASHIKTGICKGYGFVKYADPGAAAHAMAEMHGYQIENKKLVVRIAGTEPSSTANSNLESSIGHALSPPAMYPINASAIQILPYTVQGQGQNPSPLGVNLSDMHPSGTIFAQTLPCIGQKLYPASSTYQLPNYGGQNKPYPFHGKSHYRPWVGQPFTGFTSSVQSPACSSTYAGDVKASTVPIEFPGFRSSLNSEFGQSSSLFDSITRPPAVEQGNIGVIEASKALNQFPGFRSSLNSDNDLPRSSLFDFQ